MPTEARNFKEVDRVWRSIQEHTLADTHVLAATEYRNMLNLLKTNNALLDNIQKGLNDYLEKKRLFFPRFFFLSNDELLEILSETRDPTRVQPHLKKCFEGINALEFTPEEEITGIISAEKEMVPLSGKIVPAEAKGMVEKWLVLLEKIMIQSIKDVISEAVKAYETMDRWQWLLNFPGQVVQCGNCIHWTTNVTNAILNGTLAEEVDKCTRQIETSVMLVQKKLDPDSQITIEALIVIDVHGKYINLLTNESFWIVRSL